VSEVRRVGENFEKRYSVLWPWLPLAGLLKANMPTLDARDEAANAERLRALGIAAPQVLDVSSRWRLTALGPVHESAVTLAPLEGQALDRLLGEADAATRRAVARALGETVARMHRASVFHRDLYLCHVVWDGARIGVLDVARAGVRHWRRERWRVKDLAALALSGTQSTLRDKVLFLRAYFGAQRRIDRDLVRRVVAKTARMRAHGKKA
jgi:heptose I phosphotransferase